MFIPISAWTGPQQSHLGKNFWKLLRHCGIPDKLISLIRSIHMTGWFARSLIFIHDNSRTLSLWKEGVAGVPSVILSLIYLLAMHNMLYRIKRRITENRRTCLQWTHIGANWTIILKCEDDLALPAQIHNQVEEKTKKASRQCQHRQKQNKHRVIDSQHRRATT